MASFTYSFNLHFKGEQEIIEKFRDSIKKIASNYTNCNLEQSPTSMEFYIEEVRGEFYSPFEPIINDFTGKTGKPLSFFFELVLGESSSSYEHHCGYAIFEDGDCSEEETYPMGKGNSIKKRLAEWFGIESGIADDAVDEQWQYQVLCMLDDVDFDAGNLFNIDNEYRTVEVCLAAVSKKIKSGKTFEELEKYLGIPDHLRDSFGKLIKEGYNLEYMEGVPDDLWDEVINVLISGKGFTIEELIVKIKQYTSKDMR